jgi:hypothetical protein
LESCSASARPKPVARVARHALAEGRGGAKCLGEISVLASAFLGTTEAPLPATAGELLVVVDTCSVEVFSDDGLVALTNLVFAAEPPTPAA